MSMEQPKEGELFAGKFRIEKLLGQGGMGSVYLAVHEQLRQKFAIKVLLGEIATNPEAVARFINEASSAAAIQGDNVVRVSDVSTTPGGLPYMVMEYLEGVDLAQLLEQRGNLQPAEAADAVLQALEAVHQAHEMRIVHRDLKPSNLFLAKRPDGSTIVKVLDFGISKVQGLQQQVGSLTRTQSMLGSPLYMSPEQLRSSKSVDHLSDIWALGVILYELISGHVPYNGDSIGELFAAILEQDAIRLIDRVPGIDPQLDAVVMRCLAKKKDERWQSVLDLAVGLAPFAPPGREGKLAARAAQGLIRPASVPPGNMSLSNLGVPAARAPQSSVPLFSSAATAALSPEASADALAAAGSGSNPGIGYAGASPNPSSGQFAGGAVGIAGASPNVAALASASGPHPHTLTGGASSWASSGPVVPPKKPMGIIIGLGLVGLAVVGGGIAFGIHSITGGTAKPLASTSVPVPSGSSLGNAKITPTASADVASTSNSGAISPSVTAPGTGEVAAAATGSSSAKAAPSDSGGKKPGANTATGAPGSGGTKIGKPNTGAPTTAPVATAVVAPPVSTPKTKSTGPVGRGD
jgi:eukaryotic-like serine/threonine-protein kinase